MYSVGILLYELYQPFLTEMERRIALNDLRSNSLPTEFVEQWPSEVRYIGYEPAGLTVHPPPPRMIEGGFIFFVWVSSVTKIFS